MKNKIGVIIILYLIVFQFYYIYNKSYSGYIFNYRNTHEKNNINYVVLSNGLELIKEIVPNDKETVLSIFINNEESKYDISLQYWYDRTMLYPINLPRDFCNLDIRDYDDDKFSTMIANNKVEYIVIVGKDTKILNVTTEKDINIYKMVNKRNMEKIASYDLDLYSLEDECKKYDREDLFTKIIDEILRYVGTYKNYYSTVAADYLVEYANDLYENNYDDKAIKYYQIYNKIGILNAEAFYNLANLYNSQKDYKNALEQISYCIALEDCPSDAVYLQQELVGKVK